MQETAERLRNGGKRIGLIPTMGFLHDGHLSLVRRAREHSVDCIVMSLFVNPTQFSPDEDFHRYPRDFERDKNLASGAGVDILFFPSLEEIYPKRFLTAVSVDTITTVLEGKIRPTHFRGVTTIVAKLFHLTKPHVAVFGQKDAQQAVVIQQMVRDLNFDTQIIVAPIVREADGLAMSSRNVYLSPEERNESTVLYRSLCLAQQLIAAGERDSETVRTAMNNLIAQMPHTQIDYISIADALTLEDRPLLETGNRILISLAVRFTATRLIDNCLLTI